MMLKTLYTTMRDNKQNEIIAYYRDNRRLTIRHMLHYCGALFRHGVIQ